MLLLVLDEEGVCHVNWRSSKQFMFHMDYQDDCLKRYLFVSVYGACSIEVFACRYLVVLVYMNTKG